LPRRARRAAAAAITTGAAGRTDGAREEGTIDHAARIQRGAHAPVDACAAADDVGPVARARRPGRRAPVARRMRHRGEGRRRGTGPRPGGSEREECRRASRRCGARRPAAGRTEDLTMAEHRTRSAFPARRASAAETDKALREARAMWPAFDRLDAEIQE